MDNDGFFDKQTDSSRIKANIVAEYFPKYCRILSKKHTGPMMYLDLFAGPGIYKDESHSTPMLIGRAIADDSALVQKVKFAFNDNQFKKDLEYNFTRFFPTGTFTHPPRFGDHTVGESDKISAYLTRNIPVPNPCPTLLFFDPWGYKGIDTLSLAKFLEGWGNEIFLFVNIKRIQAAIVNDKFDLLMQSLFPTTINTLRNDRKYVASPLERLSLIMDNLANEFKRAVPKGLFHCAFKFQEEDSVATSHFIIHFTKHPKGYELVKSIYYGFDNIGADLDAEGNYTFDAKRMNAPATGLNFGDINVDTLREQLAAKYKGKTVSAKALFEEHHPQTLYSGRHYTEALRSLVEERKATSIYTDNRSHKVSVLLIDKCMLTFD